jgi:hypothetical protein
MCPGPDDELAGAVQTRHLSRSKSFIFLKKTLDLFISFFATLTEDTI